MKQTARQLHEANLENLTKALLTDDDLTRVLRGHLHVEHQLNELISLTSNSELASKKIIESNYNNKVFVACSLGLNDDLISPLTKLGSIRNNFAHKLDHSLTITEMQNFHDRFGPSEIGHLNKLLPQLPSVPKDKRVRDLLPEQQFVLYVLTLRSALIVARVNAAVALGKPIDLEKTHGR